jgi:hypothetical protein
MGIIAASRLRGSGSSLFLNDFSDASLGLSLELLDVNYVGFCIKVRRSSDNAVQDIGFVNGVLDTASLLTFVGSGDGFVIIIYDQVGSNDMTQTTSNLQGQIVSNGSVIKLGDKPCIIRSLDNNGGYLSTYTPNDGVTVKGMFYIGKKSGSNSCMFASNTGYQDFGFIASLGNSTTDSRPIISKTKVDGSDVSIVTRNEAFKVTDNQFLLYREIEFNFDDNEFGLGYTKSFSSNIGMMTFQELVIFENTDDAVAKENNINGRYNIY